MLVFVAVLLIAVVVGFVGYPLLVKEEAKVTKRVRKRGKARQLDFKADDIGSALGQLEIDFNSGAITEEEYIDLKVKYGRRLEVNRSRSKGKGKVEVSQEEADIERRVKEMRQSRRSHCPKCRASVRERNKFCPDCGTRITPRR